MQAKTKKYLLYSILALVIILLIVGLTVYFTYSADDTITTNKVVVTDAINNEQTITIPIKKSKVIYSPNNQLFYSDTSLSKLCENAAANDSTLKYELHNDKAYIYKVVDNKIVARIALQADTSKSGYNYRAHNMLVKDIVFPVHLTEKVIDSKITINNELFDKYAVTFMTIDDMSSWLNCIGIYDLEINAEKDTIICTNKTPQNSLPVKIHFNGNLVAIKIIH
ncbi:MAG: hypothetical protein K2P12_01630 [Clostridia bacterium]|nr:hypothetical protein [Clostridia bacterium]